MSDNPNPHTLNVIEFLEKDKELQRKLFRPMGDKMLYTTKESA
jgi:hypothetical protein